MTRPWQEEISGLVNNPHTLDVDALVKKMPLEERAYRHRCVEAWAMAVPWSGFPFKELIKMADPKSEAKYVRMVTFLNREQAPGQNRLFGADYWPYQEGLTIEEASN
jgi:sulfoxide reductase catalytic subunit YedY